MTRVGPRGLVYTSDPVTDSTTSLAFISSDPNLNRDELNGSLSKATLDRSTVENGNNGLLYGKMPRSYHVAAWVSCFFGFPPIGIVAVVFSYKTREAMSHLDMQSAYHFSKRAKFYTKMSVYTGVLLAVVIILALRTAWSLGAI